MRIRINNEIEVEVDLTMKEIAKRISKEEIDCNPDDSIINWGEVWNVVKLI